MTTNTNKEMTMKLENTIILDPFETKRTYTFPSKMVVLEDVIELTIRDSGTHRLKTKDGHLHIIPAGWVHIELEVSGWTV